MKNHKAPTPIRFIRKYMEYGIMSYDVIYETGRIYSYYGKEPSKRAIAFMNEHQEVEHYDTCDHRYEYIYK